MRKSCRGIFNHGCLRSVHLDIPILECRCFLFFPVRFLPHLIKTMDPAIILLPDEWGTGKTSPVPSPRTLEFLPVPISLDSFSTPFAMTVHRPLRKCVRTQFPGFQFFFSDVGGYSFFHSVETMFHDQTNKPAAKSII